MAYVGLDRGIVDHWIYQDAEYFKVWFEMLYRARFSKDPERKMIEGKLVTIEYGQFLFGRTSWSERLRVSERRLRTLFERLSRDDMIRVVAKYPKFTLYEIANYEKYNSPESRQELAGISPNLDHHSDQQSDQSQQGIPMISDQQNDQQVTSRRPAGDQQVTTQEERKKEKNEKKEIKKNPSRKPVYDENSSPYKLAAYLYSKICEWTEQVNPPNLQTWANECRLILETDKRDKQSVKDVIDWATKDDFWQSNILSPKSLRKQFVRLSIELTKTLHKNNGNYASDLKIIPGGKQSSITKLQELYKQAEEDEQREANGGY